MKKGEKTALVIAGLALLSYFGYKRYKKLEREEKESSNSPIAEEKPETSSEENLSSVKDVEDSYMPEPAEDGNLVKSLFKEATTSVDFELDEVKVSKEILEDAKYNTVYLMQTKHWDKATKREVESLEIHLQIPDYSPDFFKMKDFIKAGKNLALELHSQIRFVEKAHVGLCGWLVIGLADEPDGEPTQRVIRIPAYVYEDTEYATDSRSGGLEEFVRAISDRKKGVGEILKKTLHRWVKEEFPDKTMYHLNPIDAFLTYRISFDIANPSEDPGLNHFGIDRKTGLNCLKYILDEFTVTGGNYNVGSDYFRTDRLPQREKELIYEQVVFCAPDDYGKWSFLRFYNYDKNGQVVCDSYNWPDFWEEDDDE